MRTCTHARTRMHTAPPLPPTVPCSMKRTEPSPEVNFTFVVLIVVIGLTIVLAIPYFLLQRRVGAGPGKKGANSGSFITSFAEVGGGATAQAGRRGLLVLCRERSNPRPPASDAWASPQ